MSNPPAIEQYLASHKVRKLQLGASINFLEGWLNTDRMPSFIWPPQYGEYIILDAAKPFPIEADVFDYVFSEHMIEHLSYAQGLSMLSECHRILKPGGKIRIATPDLEVLLSLYTSSKNESQEKYIEWITDSFLPEVNTYSAVFVINNAFRNWGHQFIYDFNTLKNAMDKSGFIDIISCSVGESSDENLHGLESHGKIIDNDEINRFETMVLEGTVPPERTPSTLKR